MSEKSTYRVEFTVTVDVTFDPRGMPVGLTPDDEWRRQIYDHIRTPEDVAEFLAYNHLANGVDEIRTLDGFADREDGDCTFGRQDWSRTEVERIK